MNRILATVSFLALLVVHGCATGRSAGETAVRDEVPVIVENQNFYQATIFAQVDSRRVRLGEVPGNSTARFTARTFGIGEMTIEVRLLAVGAFTSFPVTVSPGDTVRVTVPPNLHRYPARPRG